MIDLSIDRLHHIGGELGRYVAQRSFDLFGRLTEDLTDLLRSTSGARCGSDFIVASLFPVAARKLANPVV